MKKKFIIMTPSIIRPKLHNISIKNFYDNFYLKNQKFIDEHYEIHHIINIDAPENLKLYSNQDETLKNFNEIIPENIKKIFIITETPKFSIAHKNILQKIRELNLISKDYIYWWFEDDWKIINNNINFFNFIFNTYKFNNLAYSMVRDAPLGSFRGGPLMNGTFFLNYFDLYGLGIGVTNRDPERQFSKYITANKYFCSGKRKIIHVRDLINDSDKLINIILIYTSKKKISPDFYAPYYKEKFNKDIKIKYHLLIIENNNFDNVLFCEFNYDLDNNSNLTYEESSFDSIIDKLNSDSITYIILKPYIFEDCGRNFIYE